MIKKKNNKEQPALARPSRDRLVRDPVCGMWIEPKDAADETLYKDKIFYFCAPGCKMAFEKEPEKFIEENQKK